MQQANSKAKPSGRQWTCPNEQAWVNVNGRRAPKNERQAYQHLARIMQLAPKR